MADLIKLLLFIGIGYFLYSNFWGNESGCAEYSSKYSCEYVKNKASYNVYYWHNVQANNPSDEKYIATVVGLSPCRNAAESYSRSVNEKWNDRSYICVLMKDGRAIEKHR